MKCNHCSYEFDIKKFAYRNIRRCPTCHTMYEMIFPKHLFYISLGLSLVLSIVSNIVLPIYGSVMVFFISYNVIDIGMKLYYMKQNDYQIKER